MNVIELREYTLHPGQRDVLIRLFERELVHTQEAVGIRVMHRYRDLERADRFIWMRGFPSMDARAASLQAFYGGPVWKAHRQAANATMIDSDNVLLLHPAWPGAGVETPEQRPVVHVCSFASEAELAAFVAGQPRAAPGLRTADVVNTFPALPVREGEHVFVGFAAPVSVPGIAPTGSKSLTLERVG